MTEVVVVYEPTTLVRIVQPGLVGPPGPAGSATVSTGPTPPSPPQEGQMWRDPATGRLQIYSGGAWQGSVLDGLYF